MAESSLPPASTPTGFLNIPLELRRQIYQECLVHPSPLTVNYLWNDILPGGDTSRRYRKSLLLVSQQISEEALEVLYGNNIFRVDLNPGGGTCLQKNFTSVNRKRIRRLQVVIHDYDQCPDSMLQHQDLWSPILTCLSSLVIVMKQPLASDPLQGVSSMEEWLKDWMKWVRPMMEYMSKEFSSCTAIEVDGDGREEIGAMMKECFPAGYREVQTRAGDWIFRRGHYFWEYSSYVRELRRDAEDD